MKNFQDVLTKAAFVLGVIIVARTILPLIPVLGPRLNSSLDRGVAGLGG